MAMFLWPEWFRQKRISTCFIGNCRTCSDQDGRANCVSALPFRRLRCRKRAIIRRPNKSPRRSLRAQLRRLKLSRLKRRNESLEGAEKCPFSRSGKEAMTPATILRHTRYGRGFTSELSEESVFSLLEHSLDAFVDQGHRYVQQVSHFAAVEHRFAATESRDRP